MITIQIKAIPAQIKQINDFVEKIGAEVVKEDSKKEIDSVFLDNREQCKRIQNEIIKGYNKKAKSKAKLVI